MKTPPLLFALLLAAGALVKAEPSRVWKLWDGQAPGDFTVPSPELVTPPKPGESPPILRLTNIAWLRLEIYEPTAA